MKPDDRRLFIVAVSLANLWFMTNWIAAYARLRPANLYYFGEPPGWTFFAGAILNVLLLALLIWLAARLVRGGGSRWLRVLAGWAFLFSLLIPLNVWRLHSGLAGSQVRDTLGLVGAVLVLLVALAALVLMARNLGVAVRGAMVLVTVLAPFVLVTFGQSAWAAIRYGLLDPAEFRDQAAAGPVAPADPGEAGRVVWLVFDELDQHLAFRDRPADVELPAFDRLRDEAIYAPEVEPVAFSTELAIPAFLTGERVLEAEGVAANELRVVTDTAAPAGRLGELRTVFTEARERGLDAALVGWYHPYCRMLADELTRCAWYPHIDGDRGLTLGRAMLEQQRRFLGSVPGFHRIGWMLGADLNVFDELLGVPGAASHTRQYRRILDAALAVAADPEIELVFIHLPVPHLPPIYDRAAGRFEPGPGADYFDNLVLADRTLATLRDAMERAGVWDSTAVLVTSDHPQRIPVRSVHGDVGRAEHERYLAEHGRVPFLLKMPGQTRGTVVDAPFSALVAHEIVLRLLNGHATPGQVAGWIQNRKNR